MKPKIIKRLNALQRDFVSVVGQRFNYFFCPILFVDEETELCEAHIVNEAFTTTSRKWTLQRKDVDNFFGTMFESAFVDLQFNKPGVVYKALLQSDLHQRLRPKILLDGVEVEHFVAKGPIPNDFAELQLEHNQDSVRLGLKMPKDRLALSTDLDIKFEVSRDLRVPAVVSLLKAAHLTMFELLGYTYSLGPGGIWLGQLLGTFYAQNKGREKKDVLRNAVEHFSPFAAMVRPVLAAPTAITGTIDDGWVHLCWPDDITNYNTPWGFLVYVRTSDMLHAVLLPALEHQVGVDRFVKFLRSQGDVFEVSIARYADTHWAVQKERRSVQWPPAMFD